MPAWTPAPPFSASRAAGSSPASRCSSAPARVLARMFGARELVLGVGTITSVKERTQDAEWVSASAIVDAVDGLAMAFSPGVPRRSRPAALVGTAAALLGMQAARQLADERQSALTAAAIADE